MPKNLMDKYKAQNEITQGAQIACRNIIFWRRLNCGKIFPARKTLEGRLAGRHRV